MNNRSRVRTIVIVAAVLLMIGLLYGSLVRADGGNRSATQGDPIAVIGENVTMHVAKPFEVATQWMGIPFPFYGQPVKIWPGQKIAEGSLKITNVSPFDYSAYVVAEPMEVMGNSHPWFDIGIVYQGIHSHGEPIVVPAGATVKLSVTVKLSYGSYLSVFRGLIVYVNAGPPPVEQTSTGGCSTDGKCLQPLQKNIPNNREE